MTASWYKAYVPLWVERYIIPILAAVVVGLVILNPLKLDWPQRISLLVALSAFAYFLAHTIHKPKASSTTMVTAPDPRIGTLEREVSDLRAQQQKLLEQQSAAEEEKKRKKKIRAKLGELLGQGQQLMIQCGNEQAPAPEEAANKWADTTEKFLEKELGPEYVSRFRSGAGMPLSATSIVDPAHRNLWSGLNVRVYRLEQFLAELKD